MKRLDAQARFQPRLRPLSLAVALAFAPAAGLAQVMPTLPNVVRGSASVSSPSAGQMLVNQSSQNTVINWQSFSIGANGKVTFSQPNSQSIALNRVVGSDPSSILGTLNANGKVFLVNPNGVLFGAGSSVNVGGLVASTLNIGDDDFMAGRYSFTRGAANPASVVNEGQLTASPGGVIALIGSTVENRGTVSAVGGTAVLASGKTVTLDFAGDGLAQLRVTEADLQALVSNTGTLVADGGKALMLADATQATSLVVNQGGLVRARSLSGSVGEVVIAGGGGDVGINGSIDTTGSSASVGGNVSATGRNVGLLTGGTIDASGGAGGGHVELVATKVGTDGGMAVVQAGATIATDAIALGNGGRVDLTGSGIRLNGTITARGADGGGDGGLVKLTASGGLDTAGMRVDASAKGGVAGTLDIDPADVNIINGSAPPPAPGLNPFTPTSASTTVYATDINNVLNANTPVTISTGAAGDGLAGPLSGTITFGDYYSGAQILRDHGDGSAVTLTLNAVNGIQTTTYFGGSNIYSIGSTSGPLNVVMNASNLAGVGIRLSGFTIATDGGALTLNNTATASQTTSGATEGISISNGTITTNGGAVTLTNTALITQYFPGIYLNNTNINSLAGHISLVNVGNTDYGSISVNSGTWDSGGGAITLSNNGKGGISFTGSTVNSSGGDMTVTNASLGTSRGDGVSLYGATIDTRVGQLDANQGGNLNISSTLAQGIYYSATSYDNNPSAISLSSNSALNTSTGGISMVGIVSDGVGTGISIASSSITSTSGAISMTGLGRTANSTTFDTAFPASSPTFGVFGIQVGGSDCVRNQCTNDGYSFASSRIRSATGPVDVRGRVDGIDPTAVTQGSNPSIGIYVDGSAGYGSSIVSGGNVSVAGSNAGVTAGVDVNGYGSISGANVIVRAGNDPSDARHGLQLDGTIAASNVANVRWGGVDSAGNIVDRNDVPITLGGYDFSSVPGGGISIPGTWINRITGTTVVYGSDTFTNAINVVGANYYDPAIVSQSSLTLQTAGNIAISGRISVDPGKTLALVAGGTVTQTTTASAFGYTGTISADNLLVRASGATLQNTANAVGTLAAVTGAGGLSFEDGRALTLGSVAATGVAGAAFGAVGATSLAGGADFVRTSVGPLTLAGNIASTGAVDLVTPTIFVNNAPNTIAAGSAGWRIYAQTWVNESRGGLQGSGTYPNVYGCTYASPTTCVASPVVGQNTFVYANRPTLSLVVDNKTRTYGDSDPAFTVTPTGLINGDLAANIIGNSPTSATNAMSPVLPGGYTISGSTLKANAGYLLTGVTNGILTINRRPLLIAANPATRTYGNADPAFSSTFTGLASFDSAAPFNVVYTTPLTTTASPVGAYANAIVPTATANPNYIISYANGTLTVTQRPLQIVVGNGSRLYGDANPVFTGSVTGLASFDTQTSVGLAYNSVGVQANVGSYPISPSLNATASSNYAIAATPGTLTINAATLTYTADPQTRTIFQSTPTLTGAVSGFRNADTIASSTTGALSWTTNATSSSPAGSYAINGSGLVAQNYVFVQAPGNTTALGVTGPSVVEKVSAGYMAEVGYASVEPRRDDQSTYVYDQNQGHPQMCVPNSSLTASGNPTGLSTDLLAIEWSRLRSRPNVATCFASGSKGGCSDF